MNLNVSRWSPSPFLCSIDLGWIQEEKALNPYYILVQAIPKR